MADGSVKGLDGLLGKLEAMGKNIPASAQRAALGQAQKILARAQELCPVDTGALKASGYVKLDAAPGADSVAVAIGFSAPYAVPVHERYGVRHPVGQAGFLRAAMDEAAAGAAPEMAAILREGLGGK